MAKLRAYRDSLEVRHEAGQLTEDEVHTLIEQAFREQLKAAREAVDRLIVQCRDCGRKAPVFGRGVQQWRCECSPDVNRSVWDCRV
ncbi:MAG: hypothetical protein ACXVAO_13700 [Vulcanimicrobiaceae bacterium]